MDKSELESFCRTLAEKLQQENNDVEIVFVNQKDMWFNLTCSFYDVSNDTNIDLNSKVDIDLNDTSETIEKRVIAEIKNLMAKKKDLEDKNAGV
jgi:hypothetical protein